MRKLVAYVVLATLCTSAHSGTATSTDDQSISLNDALQKTIEHNPELIAFGYQLEAQQAQVLQAGLAPNPELDFQIEDALGTGDFTGIKGSQSTLSLAYILERGKRERRIDAARAGVSLIEADAEIGRLDAAAETARRFLTSLANQARLVRMSEAVTLAKETVDAVNKRVRASRTPKAELARAEAELARVLLEREDVEHELLSSNRRLAAQWGSSEPGFSRVSGDIYALPETAAFESLKAKIEQNPNIARFLSEQRLREAELRLAKARAKPDWRVTAGVRRLEGTNDQAFVAGITIPLALRNRNQGRIAETRANLAGIDAVRQAARTRIETELFVLYQEALRSLQRAETIRKEIIPRAEFALVDTRRAYELGRYGYLEWRVVQADLLQARTDLVEASADAHRNVIEIERLTGEQFTQPVITP